MKSIFILMFFSIVSILSAQNLAISKSQEKKFHALVENYTKAREEKDTTLLKSLLTDDIDQLVSSGEWRNGKGAALSGMMQSSTKNPGKRTITIDKMKALSKDSAILDAKYSIENADGSFRKMWSSFIVVRDAHNWKISAIRNMLPTNQK